ncbi:MAG: hypothetical protein GTN75_03830, partial [Gemmatimonadetes bacterium]|nr:hypothetical protein [Gemmatimonadota bacterium]
LGPAAVNLSDTNGRYGFVICTINNADATDARVTISDTISAAPNGCEQEHALVLPGQLSFIVLGGEVKSVVERVRLECHDPAVPQVYNLAIEKCIDPEPLDVDDDGDTLIDEDPIDGEDNDGDTKVDEDPPEGDQPQDCEDLLKPVVIE